MTSVVLLSGGMDSTTLLAWVVHYGPSPVAALSVDYGQRHARELDSASRVAQIYGVNHQILDFRGWGSMLTGSSLTDRSVDVPLGHYAAPSMVATIVPNRNATFLMAAVGIAQTFGADVVLTAVHAGDHAVYPDCRPEFIDAANQAALLGTGGAVGVRAPFVDRTKTEIAVLARDLGAPVDLSWSCYQGGDVHCGQCGTCVERIEAFRDAGVADVTEYAPL